MNANLTGLSADALSSLLDQMRAVAARSGEEALAATDVFIWAVLQAQENGTLGGIAAGGDRESEDSDDERWEDRQLVEDLERLLDSVRRLRETDPMSLQGWEGASLRQQADNLGRFVSAAARERGASAIATARQEAHILADVLTARAHELAIVQALTHALHSTSSVQRVCSVVDRALAALQRAGTLTPEIEAKGRAAKARAARHRAQKKLDEAEVALAGGNAKKGDKLRREAAALLAQDWPRAFAGETPPTLG